jgi:hypothetical protein
MNTLDTPSSSKNGQPIFETILTYGAYLGAVMVAFSLLTYLADINLMTGVGMLTIYGCTLAICFVMAVFAMKHQRDKLDGGLISYGKALLIGIGVILIGMLISSLWNYVLINYIDPSYLPKMKEQFVANWGEMMPEDKLEETLVAFDKGGNFLEVLKSGLMGGVMYGLIVGLITAAFMKRSPQYGL